jgi:hypothetical protein
MEFSGAVRAPLIAIIYILKRKILHQPIRVGVFAQAFTRGRFVNDGLHSPIVIYAPGPGPLCPDATIGCKFLKGNRPATARTTTAGSIG